MSTRSETKFLQTFDQLVTPAEQALDQIVGRALTSRQRYAVVGLLHALADQAASAQVRRHR